MLKKIGFCLLCALLFMAAAEFDTEKGFPRQRQIENGAVPQGEVSFGLTEGGRRLKMGMDFDEVLSLFGDPVDSFVSEYGFTWHSFHEDFKNYIQIGEQNRTVCAIYTNSPRFSFCGIGVGTPKEEVHLVLETPLDAIIKGNTKYVTNGFGEANEGLELFLFDNQYITVFYDTFKNNSVTSVNIIEYHTEQDYKRLYGEQSTLLKHSFEIQNFNVTNALRVREGLRPFSRNPRIYEAALHHARDMAENRYFSHTDLNGGSVADRAKKQGVHYTAVGENIAMGAQNTLYMHELLMNSEGHRKNLLAPFRYVGCGVAFDRDHVPYLAQNFFK